MGKVILTNEESLLIKKSREALEKIEKVLEEYELELVLEGETMFLRTMDDKNVFAIVDRSLGSDIKRAGVVLLPRTTDSQDLFPIRLSSREPKRE